MIERLANDSTSKFKDFLWLRFRNQAQRILISELLNQKEKGSLDQFETYFTDFIEEEQLYQLKQEYKQTIQFSDIKEMINQALMSSRRVTQSLNFYENLQAQIIQAAFNSSENLAHNYWDDIIGFMSNHIDPRPLFDDANLSKFSKKDKEKFITEHSI